MLDINYCHNEDLGEPIGILYGVNVYGDPSSNTLQREHKYILESIKQSALSSAQPTYLEPQLESKAVDVTAIKIYDGMRVPCKDKSTGILFVENPSTEFERWSMHKDEGTSYWRYTAADMQVVLRREMELTILEASWEDSQPKMEESQNQSLALL